MDSLYGSPASVCYYSPKLQKFLRETNSKFGTGFNSLYNTQRCSDYFRLCKDELNFSFGVHIETHQYNISKLVNEVQIYMTKPPNKISQLYHPAQSQSNHLSRADLLTYYFKKIIWWTRISFMADTTPWPCSMKARRRCFHANRSSTIFTNTWIYRVLEKSTDLKYSYLTEEKLNWNSFRCILKLWIISF